VSRGRTVETLVSIDHDLQLDRVQSTVYGMKRRSSLRCVKSGTQNKLWPSSQLKPFGRYVLPRIHSLEI
jgi:hypothetical protein